MSEEGKNDSSSPVDGTDEQETTHSSIGPTKEDADAANHAYGRSEYVVVADNLGEAMELPTASDNSLFMTTLQSTFPGATGLKYKNPKTGASRAVAVDTTGTKLLPPIDGWDDKIFNLIMASSRGADVSVKRRKVGTSEGESDSDGEGRLGRKRVAEIREPAERRPVDLIVLGVNYKTTDEGFKAYFETYGGVVFGEVKRTPDGSSKGFGFVQMSTIEDQDRVLAVSTHMLDGRRCEVKIPDQRYEMAAYGAAAPRSAIPRAPVNKIFVGRLVEKIDEEQLRTFFEKEAREIYEASSVTDVFIPRPFRGFAFVTFTHSEVAERICKSNNFVIDGASISVSLAVPREEMHQQTGGYYNEYGYAYGYGKGGAGYGGTPAYGAASMKELQGMYAYASPQAQAAAYTRAAYEGWVAPPSSAQASSATPRTPGRDQWGRGYSNPKDVSHAYPVQGSSTSAPPVNYAQQKREGPALAGQAASNQIASGLDALNLNQKNPELLSAAWTAFFNTLSAGGGTPQQWPQS